MSGEAIYNQFCFACHATGVGDAPKLGDAAAWAPRIAKGMDEMLATSLKGINLMPPKGTCMNCSDDEMRSAIQHMVDAAR
jgi:cytochrome c5